MLEHFVLFATADGCEEELERVLDEFSKAISYNCGSLHEINWGRNTNPSGLQRGFTHGCLARIEVDGFQEYWDHPAHQRLMARLDELCVDRFAMDHQSGEHTIDSANFTIARSTR